MQPVLLSDESDGRTGTPRLLRAMNEWALLEHIRLHGPLSRAQLARATGLSKPTVSQALANLERGGLVRQIGEIRPVGGGRQAVLYAVDPSAGYVVGIDIGRRWLHVAVADMAGMIIRRDSAENHATSAGALVEMVASLAHATVAAATLRWSEVVHTVIGTPGVLDAGSGRVQFASNLPDWGRAGLVDMFQAQLGPSLAVDNDANLAALGELIFGCGQTTQTFVYLLVGTGVGMGIIINGALYRGAHGAGGEIGFLPIGLVESGASARTLRYGKLEDFASAEGIVRSAVAAGMPEAQTSRQIFDAARAGNVPALSVVEQAAAHIALAIASVAAILDPEVIVLGGGIGQNIDLLRPLIEQQLQKMTPLRPRVIGSMLDQDVILLGAIATGLAKARELVFQQRAGNGRDF